MMDAYYYTPVCPYCMDTMNQENMGIDTDDEGRGEVKMKCKICTHVYTIFSWKVSTHGTGDYAVPTEILNDFGPESSL